MCPKILPMENPILPPQGELVALDTSVVLELWGSNPNQQYKTTCEDFIRMSASCNNILCVTAKTLEEINIKTEFNSIPQDKRVFNMDRPLHIANSINNATAIRNELNKLPNFYPEAVGRLSNDDFEEIDKIKSENHIRWGDAVIYLQLIQEQISHIVTLDRDWQNVVNPNFTVHTPQNLIKNQRP